MAFKPPIQRNTKERGGRFAKGKYAVGICHRSGFKVPYRELKFEPGTNYLVHESENDGEYSIVTHPQNYPPEKKVERIALRWSFPDVAISIGAIPSGGALYLPLHQKVSNQYVENITSIAAHVCVSMGTATSAGPGLVFTSAGNSMYYLVIFPGI